MSLDQDIALLRNVRPFSLLDRDALRLIAFSGDKRQLRAGDVLYRKGDATFGCAVVSSGTIALDEGEGDGAPIQIVRRGALIGELALLIGTQHAARAVAREDSEVLVISRHLFRRVLNEFPQNAATIHEAYARDLANFNAQTKRVRRAIDAIK